MKAKRQFSGDILASLREGKGLRIRAGTTQHRFISIWAVVVKDRVFIRFWSVKPNGWYRTFLKEPKGTIQVADQEIAVRAEHIRDERLKGCHRPRLLGKVQRGGCAQVCQGSWKPEIHSHDR
jgi:hypothetical protein